MLVLARRVGERVLIGDDIAVTIVKSGPTGVRIGIEAPPEMSVVREELAELMATEDAARAEEAAHTAEVNTSEIHTPKIGPADSEPKAT